MKQVNLYIFTDNFFLKKDFIRFDVNKLNKFFNFKIISINKEIISLNKNIKIIKIKNLSELIKHTSEMGENYVIDLMGVDLTSWKVRKYLKKKKFKFIKILLGMTPFPRKKNFIKRIIYNLTLKKKSGGGLLRKINNNIQLNLNSKFKYDLSLVAGRIAFQNQLEKKTIKIIDFKSFDTINYEKTKLLKKKNSPIVFIDNDIAGHKDYKYHGTISPVEKKKYYKSLDFFFNFLEKKYKTKIVIALNPKSNIKLCKPNFNNRKVLQNKTSELIKNCKFTIAHSTTAISFCVLSNKPVLYITTDEIKKSWLQQEIEFSASQLKKKILNIDLLNDNINLASYLNINKKNYKNYIKNYLYRKKISKTQGFFEILKKTL